jgi:hypothetical protein
MPFVEQRHHQEVLATAFRDDLEQGVELEVDIGQRGEEGFFDESADRRV